MKLNKLLRVNFFEIYIFCFATEIFSKHPILAKVMISSIAAQYLFGKQNLPFSPRAVVHHTQYSASSSSFDMRFYETEVGMSASRGDSELKNKGGSS